MINIKAETKLTSDSVGINNRDTGNGINKIDQYNESANSKVSFIVPMSNTISSVYYPETYNKSK